MAIDYSQYARSYAGQDFSKDMSNIGAGVGGALRAAIPSLDEKILMSLDDEFQNVFGDYDSDDITAMQDISLSDAGDSYLNWKRNLTNRQEKHAKRKGLLNPAVFKQEYDKRKVALASDLSSKLNVYQNFYKKSNRDMSKYLDIRPNMRKLLLENISPTLPDGTINQAYSYIMPGTTWGEKWGGAVSGIGQGLKGMTEPEGALKTTALGIGGYGAYKLGAPQWALKKAKDLFSGKEGAKKTVATAAKSKVGKKAATGIMSSILASIEKHGAAKVAAYVGKTLGWKVAARTIAKIGLGTAVTGGIGAAAMLAWSAKDLYDIAKTVGEIDKAEGIGNEGEITPKAQQFLDLASKRATSKRGQSKLRKEYDDYLKSFE